MGKIVISENVTLDGVIQDLPARRASSAADGSPSLGARTCRVGQG
jgi:hypothetical protein